MWIAAIGLSFALDYLLNGNYLIASIILIVSIGTNWLFRKITNRSLENDGVDPPELPIERTKP